MRFARALAGTLLLVIAIVALVAAGALWAATRYADPDHGFRARFEPVATTGHAVVVTDLAALLRRDAPFVPAGVDRLRLTARTADGPVFLGLAPTDQVRDWLADTPHVTVDRVAVTRGPLPVRLSRAGGDAPVATAPDPVGGAFWVREGVGWLEWDPAEFGDRPTSLVLMRPDGRGDLALDVRVDLRAGWLGPARWALPPAGMLFVALALLLLPLRPPRPREVVFVVEPDQVPVLAQRLGVTSLSALGAASRPAGDDVPALPVRPLVAVAATPTGRPDVTAEEVGRVGVAAEEVGRVGGVGTGAAGRPSSLADLASGSGVTSGGEVTATGRPPAAATEQSGFSAEQGGFFAEQGGAAEATRSGPLTWPPRLVGRASGERPDRPDEPTDGSRPGAR
ncbi:hypothetical protein O7606_12750 [Micromonospora sp. WMMD882]|nr:hypothetical protein [Micromonospora sp. WMMD882]WBB82153.1 hypothetical protein O7606_12750 [Micromonospora sp. WMMD882]